MKFIVADEFAVAPDRFPWSLNPDLLSLQGVDFGMLNMGSFKHPREYCKQGWHANGIDHTKVHDAIVGFG